MFAPACMLAWHGYCAVEALVLEPVPDSDAVQASVGPLLMPPLRFDVSVYASSSGRGHIA
ncbi:MAG TPA: hypothetical protein VGQ57_07050 [Polyangiaceae bacterium]|nr:hypothetical protein [Polyangiaceae bacterium]